MRNVGWDMVSGSSVILELYVGPYSCSDTSSSSSVHSIEMAIQNGWVCVLADGPLDIDE